MPVGQTGFRSNGIGVEVKRTQYINFKQIERWTGRNAYQPLRMEKDSFDEDSYDEFGSRKSTEFPNFANFRLIDTLHNCLVRIPEGASPSYFTLSYVWGSSQNFLLTHTNAKLLEQRQGLRRYQKHLPRTIKDAIRITRRLHQRYLWVDALCIVQRDDYERVNQIHHMNEIYEHSELTIINASGNNSQSGFKGVFPSPRKFERSDELVKPNLKLRVHQPLAEHLRTSIYQSRAWT